MNESGVYKIEGRSPSARMRSPRLLSANVRRHEGVLDTLKAMLTIGLVLSFQGCFVAPLRVADNLDVTVVDAQSSLPIPQATLVYLVCDVHDIECRHAILARASSSEGGRLRVCGRREWGPWVPAPGGLPVPNHFVAIWAPGYSAFVFGQYDRTVESKKRLVGCQDVLDALNLIPGDRSSSDPLLNPKQELHGGKIRLLRLSP